MEYYILALVFSSSSVWNQLECSLLDITVTVPTFGEDELESVDFSKLEKQDQSKEELSYQNVLEHLESKHHF